MKMVGNIIRDDNWLPRYTDKIAATGTDDTTTPKKIPIEQRKPDEVRKIANNYISPKKVKVYNPAFDVTDHKLISAITYRLFSGDFIIS